MGNASFPKCCPMSTLPEQGYQELPEKRNLVEPFHLHITVMNKQEVLKRKAGDWFSGVANAVVSDELFASVVAKKIVQRLPEKAHEKAGIQFELRHIRSESHGTKFVMSAQLIGITWEELGAKALNLDKASAATFAESYDALLPALRKMDMAEKAAEVEASVFTRVRWKAMVKLDAGLAAELDKEPYFLKVSLEVPELQTEKAPVSSPHIERPDELGMAESEPFLLHVEITDREALLEDKGHVKKWAGNIMPEVLFDKLIEKKLEKQIPELLVERAGIVARCKRIRRREGRKETLVHDGVLVEVTISRYTEFPPCQLLISAKGEQFTEGFVELWNVLSKLEKLGVPGICYKMKEVGDRIRDQVRAGVTKKLQEALTERLKAVVTIHDHRWISEAPSIQTPQTPPPGR